METIFRQRRPSSLTERQRQDKLKKDSEYEIAVQNLSAAFYSKKRTAGVTKKEEEAYRQAKAKLWNDYLEWAKSEGLYEEVTPEQQLAEGEERLQEVAANVNAIRQELGRKPYRLVE